MFQEDNIIALASPAGIGAIAVLRISGPEALSIAIAHFKPLGNKNMLEQKSHTIHLGHIIDNQRTIDKVLLSIFKAPNSYTGENVVEISCHGSSYIQQELLQLFLNNGCRMAKEGEFTLRAFLNAKMDLSQAEAVADLISSENEASHQLAMQQIRGGFSNEINNLRQELLNFASLIELELDFSQEDVEFADRTQFRSLLEKIETVLKKLIDSFALGNVLKEGIAVAIIGEPNVGKSTLLNALLNEERAIVSDIAGTTRDIVEDQITIDGIKFRFIDTAGLRDTTDQIEQIGIQRAKAQIEKANLVLFLFDANTTTKEAIKGVVKAYPNKQKLVLINKSEDLSETQKNHIQNWVPSMQFIAAKTGKGIPELKKTLLQLTVKGALGKNDTLVSNSRHYDALVKALEEIKKVSYGLENEVSSDLMAIDIREALYHLGQITGAVTTDDLLGNIFSNFCIGK